MKESVCGIVFNEDKSKILLIKRRDIPVWVLPGGGIDPAESPEEAVVRELREETGCAVCIAHKIAEYLPVNKMTRLTHFFACSVVGGELAVGPETQELRYFPLDALPPLPPPYAPWIRDALAYKGAMLRKRIVGVSYLILLKLFVQHPILVSKYLLTKVGIHCNRSG